MQRMAETESWNEDHSDVSDQAHSAYLRAQCRFNRLALVLFLLTSPNDNAFDAHNTLGMFQASHIALGGSIPLGTFGPFGSSGNLDGAPELP
jgi:hypothetical protein